MRGVLRVCTSSRIEALVDALCRVVSEPLASPFTAETIVVPSRAMGDWLALRLAEKQGIWANPKFVTLEAFVAELAGGAGEDAFDRDTLTWTIAALLPSLTGRAELAPVAAYLEDDADGTKRLALARRVAGTFARYLAHRPEMVLAWEQGGTHEAEAWQPLLWQAIVGRLGNDHRARRTQRLLERLQKKDILDVPERVSVFAPDSIPLAQADVLAALATVTPVHVFVRSNAGHALAESLGTRRAETFSTLAGRASDSFLGLDAGAPPPSPTLAVHACHAPMRECEVLRDQLLAALDEDATLEPRDILVLCPDLETYAPVIDAVFGVPTTDRTHLPYRVVDHVTRRLLRVCTAFLAFLDLVPSRMTAPDVLDLLAREPVRAKFDLQENEMDVVRRWVSECGIRWAEDEHHRAEVGQPALRENTWRFGLDRLLLGYAMGAEERALCHEVLPYDDVEGTKTTTLGGLAAFCEELFFFRKDLTGKKSLPAWRERLLDALSRLFHASWQTEFQHQMIRDALERIVTSADKAGFTGEVPLAVVKDALDAELAERGGRLEAPAGGLTFATFASSRCVPARVVALLGMNDGDVPRAPRRDGFDLLGAKHAAGDPSPRDEDRQAFLDALLSARDALLVTYIGQSIANNAERPPSVLVSELLETLPPDVRATAVVHHPLHAFSPRYFGGDDDARLFSHASALCTGALSMLRARKEQEPFVAAPLAPSDLPRTLTVEQLARFFEHPVRAFFQTRLRVTFGSDVETVEDREPLDLGPLEQWTLGTPLLARARDGRPLGPPVPRDVVAEGALPLGVVGAGAYEGVLATVEDIDARVAEHLDDAPLPPCPFEVDVPAHDTRLFGWARNASATKVVVFTFSKLSGKQKVSAWVKHVAMNAAGLALETVLVCKDKTLRLAPLTKADAAARLADLLDLYWRGLEAPLLFFPDPSLLYVETLRKVKSTDAAMARATKDFDDSEKFGASTCPYVQRAFGGAFPLDDAFEPFSAARDRTKYPSFVALAERIGQPLCASVIPEDG